MAMLIQAIQVNFIRSIPEWRPNWTVALPPCYALNSTIGYYAITIPINNKACEPCSNSVRSVSLSDKGFQNSYSNRRIESPPGPMNLSGILYVYDTIDRQSKDRGSNLDTVQSVSFSTEKFLIPLILNLITLLRYKSLKMSRRTPVRTHRI